MAAPIDRLHCLLTESARFKHDLRNRPPDAWYHKTEGSEWDVSDVIAHLTCPIILGAGSRASDCNH